MEARTVPPSQPSLKTLPGRKGFGRRRKVAPAPDRQYQELQMVVEVAKYGGVRIYGACCHGQAGPTADADGPCPRRLSITVGGSSPVRSN